jgi:hypothetical protein
MSVEPLLECALQGDTDLVAVKLSQPQITNGTILDRTELGSPGVLVLRYAQVRSYFLLCLVFNNVVQRRIHFQYYGCCLRLTVLHKWFHLYYKPSENVLGPDCFHIKFQRRLASKLLIYVSSYNSHPA